MVQRPDIYFNNSYSIKSLPNYGVITQEIPIEIQSVIGNSETAVNSVNGRVDTRTLSGYVTNWNNIAFYGVTVSANGKTVKTNSKGFYSLDLDKGTYTVTYSYVSAVTQQVTVTISTNTTQNIKLERAYFTIEGYLKDSKTNEALTKAFIMENNLTYSVDSSGYYSIIKPYGTYTLSYMCNGYTTQTNSMLLNSNKNLDINLVKTYRAIPISVAKVSTGATVIGATVTFTAYGESIDGSNGTANLQNYTYAVTISADGYNTYSTSVTIDDNTDGLIFYIQEITYSISGSIYDNTASSLSSTTLTIDGNTVAVTGNTYITNVTKGTYLLACSKTGYVTDSHSVTVTNSNVTQDFTLRKLCTVSGIVSDGTNPISAATVTFGGTTVSTDTNGNYTLTIASGSYSLTAYKSGYTTYSETITITEDTTKNITLISGTSSITVTGLISTASSTPLSNAYVFFDNGTTITEEAYSRAGMYYAMTGSDGTYSITIPSGSYNIYTSCTNYGTDIKSAQILSTDTTYNVSLSTNTLGTGIGITALDEYGNNLIGAKIYVDNTLMSITTGLTFTALESGTYDISVSHNLFNTQTKTQQYVSPNAGGVSVVFPAFTVKQSQPYTITGNVYGVKTNSAIYNRNISVLEDTTTEATATTASNGSFMLTSPVCSKDGQMSLSLPEQSGISPAVSKDIWVYSDITKANLAGNYSAVFNSMVDFSITLKSNSCTTNLTDNVLNIVGSSTTSTLTYINFDSYSSTGTKFAFYPSDHIFMELSLPETISISDLKLLTFDYTEDDNYYYYSPSNINGNVVRFDMAIANQVWNIETNCWEDNSQTLTGGLNHNIYLGFTTPTSRQFTSSITLGQNTIQILSLNIN